jgi:Uma2 family endonuclease
MSIITKLSDLDLTKTYSYADYLLWQFQERVELIKGKIFEMSPAPSRKHQEVSRVLNRYLDRYFEHNSCGLYTAPFDVRLVNFKKSTDDTKVFTVVQPDLCVVCDREKLDDRGCLGSPDLVIEILSPGNSKKEMGIKFDLYEENGVKEYWIVNQSEKTILLYVLKDNKFIGLKPIVESGKLESPTFPDLKFPIKNIFKQ